MSFIVQKYGGTSTRSEETRGQMYQNIIHEVKKGNKVVAVVSAMGRYQDPYATDTLLSIAHTDFLTDEEIDRLSSIGETISTLVCKSELRKKGFRVETVTNSELGIITDSHYQDATITHVEGHDILNKLKNTDIVICPGFQGYSQNGKTTTLGRGGSDLSAIAIAIAIKAKEVEIYSDVDGIYTSDPQIIKKAKKLKYMGYSEMMELSRCGAKVLNYRCVQLAAKHQIIIHLKSTFHQGNGTYVMDDNIVLKNHLHSYKVSGITSSQNDILVTFTKSTHKEKILDKLSQTSIPIFQTSQDNMSFIVMEKDFPQVSQTIREMYQNDNFFNHQPIGKVSLVGMELQKHQDIIETIHHVFNRYHVHIITSLYYKQSISCYVERKDVQHVQKLLHNAFFEGGHYENI